ncbi:MAG: oligosaccharide flippase family protein [Candidatus Limnocylindrales bacterium]
MKRAAAASSALALSSALAATAAPGAPRGGLGRILRNAGWLLAGRVAAQLLLVLLTVLLAARLGAAGFGGYAVLAAVVFLANVVTTFGTDMALIREIAAGQAAPGAAGGRAADRGAARWSAALAVQLVLSAAAIGLIWAVAPFVPNLGPGMADALRIYAFALVPAAVFSVATAGLRGAGRMGAYAAVGTAGAAITLGAVWLGVPPGADLGRVAAVLLGVQVALAVIGWAACACGQPAFRAIPRFGPADVTAMAQASARIGILGLLGVLYQRVGVLALAMVAGPAATGWFAAASRVTDASKAGHVALFGALYPELARSHAAGEGELRTARWLTLGPAAVVSAVLLVLGPAIIRLLYGSGFEPSGSALAILALSIVPATAATHRSLELVAAGRERQMARALAASLAVLLVLLAGLVPAVGWTGAAWAVLGAEAFQAAVLLVPRGRWPARDGGKRARALALAATGRREGLA